jgi:hypothetical protein
MAAKMMRRTVESGRRRRGGGGYILFTAGPIVGGIVDYRTDVENYFHRQPVAWSLAGAGGENHFSTGPVVHYAQLL